MIRNKNIIVGIDLGIKNIGFALYKNKELVHRVIYCDDRKHTLATLKEICRSLANDDFYQLNVVYEKNVLKKIFNFSIYSLIWLELSFQDFLDEELPNVNVYTVYPVQTKKKSKLLKEEVQFSRITPHELDAIACIKLKENEINFREVK